MKTINTDWANMRFGTDSEFVCKDGMPGFAVLPPKHEPIVFTGTASRSIRVYEDAVCGEWGPDQGVFSCFGYFMDAFRAAVQYMHKNYCVIGAGGKVQVLPDPRMFTSGCNPTMSLFDGGEEKPPITEDGYKKMIEDYGACCGTHIHFDVSSRLWKNPLPLIEDLCVFVYPLYRAMVRQFGDEFEAIRAKSFYRGAFRKNKNGVTLEWKDISASSLRSPIIIEVVLGAVRAIVKAHECGQEKELQKIKKEMGITTESFKAILDKDSEADYKKMAVATMKSMALEALNSPWATNDPTCLYSFHTKSLGDAELAKPSSGITIAVSPRDAIMKIITGKHRFGDIKHEWSFRFAESHGYTLTNGLFSRGLIKEGTVTYYNSEGCNRKKIEVPEGYQVKERSI